MGDDRIQLEYAPPPRHRGRGARVWLLAIAGVLAVWAGIEWGADALRRVRIVWAQGRCAGYEFPAGAVVFDTDPQAGADLLKAEPGEYVSLAGTSVWPMQAVGRAEPDCWADLKRLLFGTRTFWPPGPPAPKALVHRLRTASGTERLVAIIVAPAGPDAARAAGPAPGPATAPGGGLGLVAAVIAPGSLTAEPRWEGNSGFLWGFERAGRVRFFAGQLDPADPARFTVRYEMDGQPGTVTGRLADDGIITMEVKDGPAKR